MTSPARMYHDYLVPAIFARWAPEMLRLARPARGQRVLDIACGTGVVARMAATQVGITGEVIALDVSAPMLEVARDLPAPDGAGIEWVEGSAQALPGSGFDVVLCQQGLQFFPDPAGAVREMRRVLADDGRAVVSVWQDIERQPVYKALMEAEAEILGVPLEQVGVPFMFERRHTLEPLFRDAGFGKVEVHEETLTAAFPYPERWVKLTVLAGAAVIPELAQMGDAEREQLVDAVLDEVAPVIDAHVNRGLVSFPMPNNIVVAYA